MLKIRLQRRGKRSYATYRVVVAEDGAPVQGRFIADVGHYNPHTNEFSVQSESIQQWLAKGAQASPTVHNLLITHNIIKGEKVTSWRPKTRLTPDLPAGQTGAMAGPEKEQLKELKKKEITEETTSS